MAWRMGKGKWVGVATRFSSNARTFINQDYRAGNSHSRIAMRVALDAMAAATAPVRAWSLINRYRLIHKSAFRFPLALERQGRCIFDC